MREMKFRAWDKKYKEMVYYNPLEFLDDLDGSDIVAVDVKESARFYVDSHRSESTTKNNVLMQYTGLKDKNGKEIYEGDILDSVDLIEKYEVKDMYELYYDNREMIIDVESCEVIGNIYENSNLLK